MTNDPRLSPALDATPLDSDVYRRRHLVEVVPGIDAGHVPCELDPSGDPAALLRCVA